LSVLYGCGERTVINEDAILESSHQQYEEDQPTQEQLETIIKNAQLSLQALKKGEKNE
jgi:hypothetical protein